jgi:hypothetical protein
VMKTCIAMCEVMSPKMDQENIANVFGWMADMANAQPLMGQTPLNLDLELIANYVPPVQEKEPLPDVESSHE